MKRLWTPWRMPYILGEEKRGTGCLFCEAARRSDDEQTYLLHRASHCFVMLNRYPYNNGHLMVVPYRHVSSLEALVPESAAELITLVQHTLRILREVYQPDGFNLGVNEGSAAGAGIEEHVHFHVVPRWEGDANYMSVVGETRVIPELLEDSYAQLAPHFAALETSA
ncbi:MAG: HIT family protein [Anaerolineae bacterium]